MDRLFRREELALDPVDLARLLLGAVLEADTLDGRVGVRLVEVEAYRGLDDPASHCYRGKTPRNAVMWGPAGHLYVYFVYGMHFCANVVGTEDGQPGAVLLRAGEVVEGADVVRKRRPNARGNGELARGPAILTSMLGLAKDQNGVDLTDPESPVRLRVGERVPVDDVRTGPRVGVAMAMDTPWRFWVDGSPAVSAYRRGGKRRQVRPAG
ncbi:DNA-3-methyladenine glycosylase [Amycolatopsis benzoatilytica]|uniref:DNA-3-methyladenine glycosylase n=1 Tax=Amycolatopsis benzoatilytica TaxID=346045 RepID=UPI00037263B8|nr:DNA-3-methyladenine glycosylase [Amycolatopsis benzoatilytica]